MYSQHLINFNIPISLKETTKGSAREHLFVLRHTRQRTECAQMTLLLVRPYNGKHQAETSHSQHYIAAIFVFELKNIQ